jgi:hypothetical protein
LKYTTLLLFTLYSAASSAESHFSVGSGKPYGGVLGGSYSHQLSGFDAYVSAGLLSYSGNKANPGWQIGFDMPVMDTNNVIGISYGTSSTSAINEHVFVYTGPSLNYKYYFSTRHESSWLLGVSGYTSKIDRENPLFDDKHSGVSLTVGYQF